MLNFFSYSLKICNFNSINNSKLNKKSLRVMKMLMKRQLSKHIITFCFNAMKIDHLYDYFIRILLEMKYSSTMLFRWLLNILLNK